MMSGMLGRSNSSSKLALLAAAVQSTLHLQPSSSPRHMQLQPVQLMHGMMQLGTNMLSKLQVQNCSTLLLASLSTLWQNGVNGGAKAAPAGAMLSQSRSPSVGEMSGMGTMTSGSQRPFFC